VDHFIGLVLMTLRVFGEEKIDFSHSVFQFYKTKILKVFENFPVLVTFNICLILGQIKME